MLTDRYGRRITYLRISVTDRCNLRCVYCMPNEGIPWQSHTSILSYEEIARVVEAAAALGVNEVRLTGGEPLVRRNLPELVRLIAAVPGIEDISLTTNGLLLEEMAAELAAAGLKRINISLDTLSPEKYARLTRGGDLGKVWRGIEAAEKAGLSPIKLNTVALRGINDDELLDQARLTLTHPWHVRFIELMPVKNQLSWGPGFPAPETMFMPIQEILALLAPLDLEPMPQKEGSGPALEFKPRGAPGRVGIISPIGKKFCENCNRLRLTADGQLRPCLLSDEEVSVVPALREAGDLVSLIERVIELKPLGHELEGQVYPSGRCMMQIGG
ncbi:MAG TPA: GTP 3',8-cyclase MoaA [Anaerolineaceae bacterium]|nr:GTP 3',8-cyclase MoaA [Anaerolineaceae bacterium]HPN53812.1 GTP 3',8-cyclase MoaA [Anaerolineaceae bacterium]